MLELVGFFRDYPGDDLGKTCQAHITQVSKGRQSIDMLNELTYNPVRYRLLALWQPLPAWIDSSCP